MNDKNYFFCNTDIGQNFLRDKVFAQKMVKASRQTGAVLEIGPGKGILTEELLKSNFNRIFAVEMDNRLGPYLEPFFDDEKNLLFWHDVLKVKLDTLLPEIPLSVIANLPYHITTPVIWKLLEELAPLGTKELILMMQKESLLRFMAKEKCKQRCPLGITLQFLGSVKKLFDVPRGAFSPMPKVNSSVIKIEIAENKNINIANDTTWRKLLRGSFANRRKTLINNWIISFDMTKDLAKKILAKSGLGENARAEELSLDKWLTLHELEDLRMNL